MKLWRFSVAVTAVIAITLLSAGVVGLTHTAQAQTATPTDYDADDDGLIEIVSAVQLTAIPWDLDGDGTPASANASDYADAFPNAAAGMGCPSAGCDGYELTADIDLDVFPYNYLGWGTIGRWGSHFTATFEGNGNTISGLSRNAGSYTGLFGYVGRAGVIRNVRLTGVNVIGSHAVGGIGRPE